MRWPGIAAATSASSRTVRSATAWSAAPAPSTGSQGCISYRKRRDGRHHICINGTLRSTHLGPDGASSPRASSRSAPSCLDGRSETRLCLSGRIGAHKPNRARVASSGRSRSKYQTLVWVRSDRKTLKILECGGDRISAAPGLLGAACCKAWAAPSSPFARRSAALACGSTVACVAVRATHRRRDGRTACLRATADRSPAPR